MTLLIDVDGRALTPAQWATHELPRQLEHVGDDVEALCVLARLLVDNDLVAHAAPLLDRLRPLAAADDDAAAAVSAVVSAIASSAVLRAEGSRGDVSGVPTSGPLWAAVLKDAGSLVPSSSSSSPRCVVFALADERGDGGLLEGQIGPQTTSSRIARGLTLVLAEQLQARLGVAATAVVPVVGDAGFFVATRAWDLLSVLPLLPSPPPRLVITGSRRARADGGTRVVLEVHDLEVEAASPRRVDAPIQDVAAALLRSVSELLALQKGPAGPLTARSQDIDDDLAGAVADVHALLLAATGRIAPQQLYNDDAAFDALCALVQGARPSVGPSSTLLLLSAIVCALSAHRAVPARALDVVDAALTRHATLLAPLLPRARSLLIAAKAGAAV